MTTKFLKLGKYTINPNSIAWIDWECKSSGLGGGEQYYTVKVYFTTTRDDNPAWISFRTDSLEAKALKQYYDSHISAIDLVRSYSSVNTPDFLETGRFYEQAEF